MNGQWKVLRPPRAAMLGLAAVSLAACAPERSAGPRAVLADGASGSARVITVVHVMRPGALVASVGYADTSSGPVLVTDGSAGVDIAALPTRPRVPNADDDARLYGAARSAAGARLEIARDDRRPSRQGRWAREVRLADGRVARIAYEASGGAPVSRTTLTIAGQTVASEEMRWHRAGGVWQLASRTVTAFREGRAVSWAEFRVESAPLRTASAAERVRSATGRVLRAGVLAAADALAPASLQAQAMTGPCGKEANTALDALKDYETSVALFATATLSGNPFAMAGAAINMLRSADKIDDTQARLDQCVDAA